MGSPSLLVLLRCQLRGGWDFMSPQILALPIFDQLRLIIEFLKKKNHRVRVSDALGYEFIAFSFKFSMFQLSLKEKAFNLNLEIAKKKKSGI